MIDLKFDTVAQLVAVSSISNQSQSELISKYSVNVEGNPLMVKFSEYVKSQVHLNIVHGLYNRSLSEYAETLAFLRGSTSKRAVAEKVLRYYYADLANFLINNSTPVYLLTDVDTPNFNYECIEYNVEQLTAQMLTEFDQAVAQQSLASDWSFMEVYEHARDVSDFRYKATNFAFGSVLLRYSRSPQIQLIKSV